MTAKNPHEGERFDQYLDEKLRDPEFRAGFEAEFARLRLAHRIAGLRRRRGLTQRELAERLGTTQSAIARLEDPNYQRYSLASLRRVARALDAELVIDLRPRRPQHRRRARGTGAGPQRTVD